ALVQAGYRYEMKRGRMSGGLQTNDDRAPLCKMMLEVGPFAAESPGVEMSFAEKTFDVGCRNTVLVPGIQNAVNLIETRSGGPILQHHPRYSRAASVFSLMDEGYVQPDRGCGQETDQEQLSDHFKTSTRTAAARAITM